MSTRDTLVLCSTHRLARSIRLAHDREQSMRGHTQWQALQAMPLGQWLDSVFEQAMLRGEVAMEQTTHLILDTVQERILWERAIESCLENTPFSALFDRSGMAATALEANRMLYEWRVSLPQGDQTEETRQFLRWREVFQQLCRSLGCIESARYFDWQIHQLSTGIGRLPHQIHLAGFDRISPQEQRFLEVLATRGVAVEQWQTGLTQEADAVQMPLDDRMTECRAAVAWAQRKLQQNPQSRIAIVSPELGILRAGLMRLLDDVLHPAVMTSSQAERPRCYDFSLGTSLADQSLVATAMMILRLAAERRRISQADFGALLMQPYWTAGLHEADGRAQLDAKMRAWLPPTVTLGRLARFTEKSLERGLAISGLVMHLNALQTELNALPERQLPSAWSAAFRALLTATGWPGTRGLSSHEFQARQAFEEVLASLMRLDALLGQVKIGAVLHCLGQICREKIFQAQVEGTPPLQVLGMLEATAMPQDAVWVMGLNDHLWPPPARPNPLLPVAAQRAARAPNADATIQTEFAKLIHQRLLHSAPEVVFSWSRKDGERELRPSPLLEGILCCKDETVLAETLAEQLAQPVEMDWLEDHLAPPVTEHEQVRGGTGLLKAQAICPAWAYYQYRLGARALKVPVEGLDALERGSLLHAVLQCFWQGRDSAQLSTMDEPVLQSAIEEAVEAGVNKLCEALDEPLPPNFLSLEKQRLHRLLAVWLEFEKTRSPFRVEECERRVTLEIAGMTVNLSLDRVDALEDGRLVVLDYKTGASVSHNSWAEGRVTEPQLPIYAALVLSGQEVAAVCFAKVRVDERKFIGVSTDSDLLPGVEGLENARKLFPEDKFPNWAALVEHWQTSITAIAEEIKAGEAAVRFEDEADLRDCEVIPLLRLPERKLQRERSLSQSP